MGKYQPPQDENERDEQEMIVEQVRRFTAHGMASVPGPVLWFAVALEKQIKVDQTTQRLLYKGKLTIDEIPPDGDLDKVFIKAVEA